MPGDKTGKVPALGELILEVSQTDEKHKGEWSYFQIAVSKVRTTRGTRIEWRVTSSLWSATLHWEVE